MKGSKINYFNNLNPKVIADNKKFWSAVRPIFSNKGKAMNTIVLHEKDKNDKRTTRKHQKSLINLLQAWQNLLSLKNVHRGTAQNFWKHLPIKLTDGTLSKKLFISVKLLKKKVT